MEPLTLMTFFNLHGIKMEIQSLGTSNARAKNRVLFTYNSPQTNTVESVGGYSVYNALEKAMVREQAELRARILRANRKNNLDDLATV